MNWDQYPPRLTPELLLLERIAVRVVYYHIDMAGNLWVMLAKHKKNQEFTLPGGRLDERDLTGNNRLIDILFHNTLFRELWEELGFDDWDVLYPIMEGKFYQAGVVMWKHPTTGQVCFDFVTGVECETNFMPILPADSEIQHVMWVQWENYDPKLLSPYANVKQAVNLIQRVCLGGGASQVSYKRSEFPDTTYLYWKWKLRWLLNSSVEA